MSPQGSPWVVKPYFCDHDYKASRVTRHVTLVTIMRHEFPRSLSFSEFFFSKYPLSLFLAWISQPMSYWEGHLNQKQLTRGQTDWDISRSRHPTSLPYIAFSLPSLSFTIFSSSTTISSSIIRRLGIGCVSKVEVCERRLTSLWVAFSVFRCAVDNHCPLCQRRFCYTVSQRSKGCFIIAGRGVIQ